MLDGDLLAGVLRMPPAEATPLLVAAAALLRARLQQYGAPSAPQAAAARGGPLSPHPIGVEAQEAWLLPGAAGVPSGLRPAAGAPKANSAFASTLKRAAMGLEQAWRPGNSGMALVEDQWPRRLRMLVEHVLSRFV